MCRLTSSKMGGSAYTISADPPMPAAHVLRIMLTPSSKDDSGMSSGPSNQMTAHPESTGEVAPSRDRTQAQHGLWIEVPFPATVRGVDTTGDRFTIDTVLDSLSAHELCLRLAHSVEVGARLFIVVRLTTSPIDEAPAARVALHGTVRRVALRPSGGYDLLVAFERHRFLYVALS